MNARRRWLDEPRNVSRLVHLLYATCALLLAFELLVHKHVHFGFEAWFGFHAAMGFAGYCGIVLSARLLRRVLRRDEAYYGDGREGDDA